MLTKLLKERRIPKIDTINLNGFSAAVKFSARRKTLTIKVESGKVLAQAPAFATRQEIEDFLRRKSTWIQHKVAQQQAQLQARQKHWLSGQRLPLLGDTVYLRVERGGRGQVSFDGEILTVCVRSGSAADITERRVRTLVQQWYKQRAATDIAARLAHWQEVTGITATGYGLKTYKARWGSCNHRAELSFNWKLIMAPPAVIDYVVVHELCHIVHFNHSPAYWRLVNRYQPHYKAHKCWLKDNGLSLEL